MLRGGQNINELVQRYESRDAQAFYEKYRVRDFSSKFSENNILYEIPGSNSSRHNDQDKQPNMKMYFKQQRKDSLVSTFSMSSDSEFEPLNPETTKKVGIILSRLSVFMEMISRLPLPRMSVTGMGVCFLIGMFLLPRTLSSAILFPGFRLIFGNLYPAYASYKAVRTKNVKEYVKWMMYWIVFAFFSCIETFTDIFLAWFPFYYEVKVVIVLWLLSPVTKGSSTLYRKFVHPMLTKRENEIDEYISQAKEKGYTAVLQLGSKGVNYATNVIMQTAIKGGGNLVQTLKRSYSLSDLSEPDIIIQESAENDEVDEVIQQNSNRILRSRTQSMRSASGGKRVEMYFPEVDLSKANENAINYSYSNIRSSEDVSSGYSSAEPISTGLSRTASLTNASRGRLKTKKAEDDDRQIFPSIRIPYLIRTDSNIYPILSEADEIEFLNYNYDQSKVVQGVTFVTDVPKNLPVVDKIENNLNSLEKDITEESIRETVCEIVDSEVIVTESEISDDEYLDVDEKLATSIPDLIKLSTNPFEEEDQVDLVKNDDNIIGKVFLQSQETTLDIIQGDNICKKPASHKKGRAPPPPPPLSTNAPIIKNSIDEHCKETSI